MSPHLLRTVQAIFLLLLLSGTLELVGAEPVSPLDMQVKSSSTRTISGLTNVSAQGGNVTELRIDMLSVTKTWQGYFGNITGNIHLDDADNNSFYVWGNASSVNGEIYASRNSSPGWSSINCTNSTQVDLENAYLGVSSGDGDSVTNTFSATAHPAFNVGLRPITNDSCLSTNIYVNGTAQGDAFYQILLSDDADSVIYTTIIEDDQYGYNSRLMDFQLMVGENEHDGNSGPTLYYFFVELS